MKKRADDELQVDVVRFPPGPFVFPFLQLQLVLVHNRSTSAITGPLAFVLDDLQNAALLNLTPKTSCFSTPNSPFVVVDGGADGVLSANETVGTLLFFVAAPSGASYLPRVTSGLPTQ